MFLRIITLLLSTSCPRRQSTRTACKHSLLCVCLCIQELCIPRQISLSHYNMYRALWDAHSSGTALGTESVVEADGLEPRMWVRGILPPYVDWFLALEFWKKNGNSEKRKIRKLIEKIYISTNLEVRLIK